MRRIATATLAGLTVFGLVNGLAASMDVTSDNLGSDSPVTAACDADGMTLSFGVTPGSAHEVTEVTFDGVAAACDGQSVFVDLLDANGEVLASTSGTISLSAGAFDIGIGPASAAAVEGANVTITGAASP